MSDKLLNIAVFISGRGSNLKALIDACKRDDFPAKIALVLSNKKDAGGLEYATDAGIATEIVDHKNFKSREDFDQGLLQALESYDIDLICLAGFMRLLTPVFINKWRNKIINIHPSLLPAYKGLNTHERVLDAGEKETGCTVHMVVPEMDSGEILVQKRVLIENNDTPESLAAKILEQEHTAYPEAVIIFAKNKHITS